jgi:hypothetical protein
LRADDDDTEVIATAWVVAETPEDGKGQPQNNPRKDVNCSSVDTDIPLRTSAEFEPPHPEKPKTTLKTLPHYRHPRSTPFRTIYDIPDPAMQEKNMDIFLRKAMGPVKLIAIPHSREITPQNLRTTSVLFPHLRQATIGHRASSPFS